MNSLLIKNWWRIAYIALFAIWALDALLVMKRVRAGFFTSYSADIALPAWLYIVFRGLHDPTRSNWFAKHIGRRPEGAALAVFLGSVLTEVSQYYWPRGVFAGRFDPWDIAAYGFGIAVCYALDRSCIARERHRSPEVQSEVLVSAAKRRTPAP